MVLVTVAISYLFWQLSAPLLRYGYAYVLLLITLVAGFLYQGIRKNGRLVCFAVLLLIAVKGVSFAGYLTETAKKPYYIAQQEYGSYDLERFEAAGISFYYPKSGDRVGYERFPAIPRKIAVRFRGQDIRDGFLPSG